MPASVQDEQHILDENEIVDGIDELGVLLYGHGKNAYWYGSQLSIEETRRIAPYQNATGLQVTSAVLAGMVWALENPKAGIVEADEMDFRRCLEVQTPYLGPVDRRTTPTGRPLDGPPRLLPGGHRPDRSLAVPERAGAVNRSLSSPAVASAGKGSSAVIGCRSIRTLSSAADERRTDHAAFRGILRRQAARILGVVDAETVLDLRGADREQAAASIQDMLERSRFAQGQSVAIRLSTRRRKAAARPCSSPSARRCWRRRGAAGSCGCRPCRLRTAGLLIVLAGKPDRAE